MAQSPLGVVSVPPSSSTLFLPHPGTHGILVRRRGRRWAMEPREFGGAAAALAWCQESRTQLVYWFDGRAQSN